MRVIEKVEFKEPEAAMKCAYCRTKFAYTNTDIVYDHRDGNYVNCPECGKALSAETLIALPDIFKQKIFKKH